MERKLAAILAADVAGYSKLMTEDEEATLAQLKVHRAGVFDPKIAEHHGRIIKLMGDGTLVEFASVVDAVSCAIAIQTALAEADGEIRLRIGINLGDVIVDGDDIYGDGVNIASRLEGLADIGGVCVSDLVYQSIRAKTDVTFRDAGEQNLKNINRPVRAWHWSPGEVAAADLEGTHSFELPEKPSIAVLPFDNMSTDPDQEFFSDGISEDIITALSKITKLFVVARNSTFAYKGKAVDIKQVGREQGVRYVLEGSVRRGGNQLRITAQLIDAQSGNHIWAERYDRQTSDLFALQDEITREVVSALQVRLTDGEQALLWKGGTTNLMAWENAVQASQLLQSHRKQDARKARQFAEAALRYDPDYAAARTILGWLHWQRAFNSWTDAPEAALADAEREAQASLSTDPENPDTHALLSMIYLSKREFDRAVLHSRKSQELGPGNAFCLAIAGTVACYCNNLPGSKSLLLEAMRLSPCYPAWYVGNLAHATWLLGDLDEARGLALMALAQEPDYFWALITLAVAEAERGELEAARTAIQALLKQAPETATGALLRTQPYVRADVLDRIQSALTEAGLPD